MEDKFEKKHIIVKWNPSGIFHELAPDTIKIHCRILEMFSREPDTKYVWWGKISKTGRLGISINDILRLNNESRSKDFEWHLYLYCPDIETPSLHVAKLIEISTNTKKHDAHAPRYYSDLKYNIPFWFKIADIKRVPLSELHGLQLESGEPFDPVSSVEYPMIVLEKELRRYFLTETNYITIMEDYVMRCFKTGGMCAFPNIQVVQNRIFIGRPFSDEHQNMYKFAIKPVLDEMRFETWKADEVFKNIDLMCKVCEGIQTSQKAIIDISGWNPNVLFELGMVYGLSRDALILKEETQNVPVDLQGLIYISYRFTNFEDLQSKLRRYLAGWV